MANPAEEMQDISPDTAGKGCQICICCTLSVLNNVHTRSELKSANSRTDMAVNREGSMSLACQSFHSKFLHTVQDVIHSGANEDRLHCQCWSEQNLTGVCSHQSVLVHGEHSVVFQQGNEALA